MDRGRCVWALLSVVVLCAGLCGCGLWNATPPGDPAPEAAQAGEQALTPAQAEAQALARQAEQDRMVGDLVPYSVRIVVEGASPEQTAVLENLMRDNSQLVNLEKEPPDSDLGLERRYLNDAATAVKVLRSEGYYEGTAACEVDWKTRPTVPVVLKLVPGRRFSVGKTQITYVTPGNLPDKLPEEARKTLADAPKTLADFGIKPGMPPVSAALAGAVEKVPDWLTARGFPFATASPVYRMFKDDLTFNAEVTAKTGPFARFGQVELHGTDSVKVDYLRRLVPWKVGDPWSSQRLDFYRDTLQQTGLFRDVRVEPAKAPGEGDLLPVNITATDADFRKISGSVRFSTDLGPGAQAVWEHKNLFSAGERLRLAMTLTRDMQEGVATFTKPAYGVAGQSLVLQAMARNERSDAYDLKAVAMEGGLDRYFDWRWWGGIRLTAQSGSTRDNAEDRGNDGDWEKFHLVGLPVAVRYFGTNSALNPTQGFRVEASVTPYMGYYKKYFTVARLQGTLNLYHAPFERPEGQDWDRLVLAARASIGAMPGSVGNDVHRIPGALRFYTGGGGSVRGYKYQSIGPEDKHGEPVGGLSFTELNFEARFRVTESVGIVPFVDAGMVYESWYPRPDVRLAWAVGLGLRYYTPIGPVRLDVAVPLQNRGGKPFHVYFSIGQSF